MNARSGQTQPIPDNHLLNDATVNAETNEPRSSTHSGPKIVAPETRCCTPVTTLQKATLMIQDRLAPLHSLTLFNRSCTPRQSTAT